MVVVVIVIITPVVTIVVDVLPHVLALFHHVFCEVLSVLARRIQIILAIFLPLLH